MLNSVFMKLLEMSAKGGIVILAVLLVRLLLRRAPRKAVFVLWAAVLLRLLCPLTLHSPVGLLPEREFIPAAAVANTPTPAAVTPAPLPTVTSVPVHSESAAPVTDFSGAEPVPMPTVTDAPRAEKHISWKEALPYLWLSGCVLLLGYSIGSGLRLRYLLRESVETETGVRVADGLGSAFVLGFFRPYVYLPSDLPEGARPYILAHERAHIRRGDTLWKRLGWLALCLHWFNPLVWLAFFLASRDMEMACDERVLAENGADIRADYSELLLRLSTGKRFLAAPLAFGEGDTGSRIRHILKWKKPRTWLMVGAALLCIAAVVFCVLERSGKETVWARELPGFRTTIRVQTDGKKYTVTHTRPKKRAADGTKSEHIRLEKPVEDADGILLTGVRDYYDVVRNRSTHDSLTLYLLTPENIKELRSAEWGQPGIRFEVRVLDGEALVILAIQQMGVNSEDVDILETGLLLASGGDPGEQALSASKFRPLSDEEIQNANERFNWFTQYMAVQGSVHAILRCYFDSPAELPLEDFLHYLPDGGEELQGTAYQEEFGLVKTRSRRAMMEYAPDDMPEPVYRFSAEKVNESLRSFMGITVDDLNMPYREMYWYLPETDAFYITDSGFEMENFQCAGGETDGETVRLYMQFFTKNAAGRKHYSVLTVQKKGPDEWYMTANQPMYENGKAVSAVPAGEWRYELPPEQMQEMLENLGNLPLDELARFLLKADGVYAEGGAAELYRRFLQSPAEIIEYLTGLGDIFVTEHPNRTAAETLGGLLISESIRQGGDDSTRETLRSLYALYPQSRQTKLLDELLLAADAAGEAASVPEGFRALTAEELRTANDHLSIPFSDWSRKQDLTGAVHAFHICHYDDPRELDLQAFLEYLFYGNEELQAGEDEEEFQLWQARGGRGFAAAEIADMPVPVHRYPREKVNEVLMEYAGITVDDLILPYWEMSYYLPETDAFYNITSDFAMGTFRCEAGETDGETVRLYTDASRHSCVVLTLRKSGEKWMIAAQQMTDENGNILSAVLAGKWRYQLSAEYMQELFEDRETLPLDKFIRFLLKADGAYAEGGAAEIYERFLRDPVTLLRYLLTWGESTVPEHPDKTAAQVICDMLAAEAAWFGDAEAFTDRLDRLMTLFPEGRGRVLVEYLRSAYTQISEALGGYTAGLAAVAPEKGLALYRDDTPAQMEQRGAFPWGLGLTAEKDEYFEDGSYRVICTDGTVVAGMYCGGDSVPNLKDVSFLYFDTQNPAFRTLNGVSVGMSRTEALERFNCPGDEVMAVCFDNEQGQIILRFADGLVSEIEMCAFGFANDRAAALGADYEQESGLRPDELDTLVSYLLTADGANSEDGAAELCRRFVSDPLGVLEYLLTLKDTTTEAHPDKTAAQALCDMLPMGVMQSDSEAAFAEAAEQCLMAFPDGKGRELAEYVWKIRRRLEFSHSNHLHMLVGAARTDAEDGLALYHDGWEKAVTLQNLGEYPWGYPFTTQDVSFRHSDGSNTYQAVCTDGTVLSGFNWDSVEFLDIASVTGVYTENPAFATPDGVRVGMKRSEVPDAPKSGDLYIAAQKDYLQLVIHFDGDVVSALELVQGMDAAVY